MLIVIDFIFDFVRLNLALVLIIVPSSTSLIIIKIKQIDTRFEVVLDILAIIGFIITLILIEGDSLNVLNVIGALIATFAAGFSAARLIFRFLESIDR